MSLVAVDFRASLTNDIKIHNPKITHRLRGMHAEMQTGRAA